MIAGRSGVTQGTPEKIMLGAGTIHKNLKYTAGTGWNMAESIVGATNGGSTLTITPEFYQAAVDGVNIPIKELTDKIGEKAELATNFAEISEEIIQASALAEILESDDETKVLLGSKANLSEGDFWENIAFVGKTLKGKEIIAILDNALCTSGLSLPGTNNEGAVVAATFGCYASIEQGNLDKLPWHIYYPKATV